MATSLDKLFASMPDAPAGGTHELLLIDPDTRQIEVPEIENVFGVITDGNAEKKYFQCPRYVGAGIDLAACRLRVAFQNASNTAEGRDGYLVQDLTESDGYVYFSWELSEKVCLYQGTVQFAVCAMHGDTVVWNTTIATGTVLEGLEYNGEIIQTEMQDVIAQLLALVEAQSASVEAAGAAQVQIVKDAAKTAQAAAVDEIEAKKQNTLAEIPADYTAMASTVDALTRSTAGAIVCAAEGETIQVADASDNFLHGLRIFGRSTQDGTPSPDSPVEIVSAPAPVVTVGGKNLFDPAKLLLATGWECDENGVYSGLPANLHALYNTKTSSICPDIDPRAQYVLSFEARAEVTATETIGGTFWFFYEDGTNDGVQITTSDFKKYVLVSKPGATITGMHLSYGFNCREYLKNLQLEIGSAATEYEPYAGHGMAITTPDSLPGIPVTSGGNYTDADGQQWICDEVDFIKGVYVQRVAAETVAGVPNFSETADSPGRFIWLYCLKNASEGRCKGLSNFARWINWGIGNATADWFCVNLTHLYYYPATTMTAEEVNAIFSKMIASETPPVVLIQLANPVEIPLTETELAAFAAMHSVKPNTTILNDAGAHMAVEYVADTKLYIDNKLAALVAAATT